MKRKLVVMSDLHCGHRYGLTPPSWGGEPGFSRQLWKFYTTEIQKFGPDTVIVNGDAIDGKGVFYGGRELIEADRHKQAEMAAEAIAASGAKRVFLLRGTRYHVGQNEDFEDTIVWMLRNQGIEAEIKNHLFLNVNGKILDIRHKIPRSTIPHGRATPLIRQLVWNLFWHEKKAQPKANITIRSHVHVWLQISLFNWTGIITPALTYHSEYGVRECENDVDVGFVCLEFEDDGTFTVTPVLWDSPVLASEVIRL